MDEDEDEEAQPWTPICGFEPPCAGQVVAHNLFDETLAASGVSNYSFANSPLSTGAGPQWPPAAPLPPKLQRGRRAADSLHFAALALDGTTALEVLGSFVNPLPENDLTVTLWFSLNTTSPNQQTWLVSFVGGASRATGLGGP